MLMLLILFSGCNKDETILEESIQQVNLEGPQGFVSFETFTQNIGESAAFRANFKHFDINKVLPPEGRGAEFIDAYIVTDEIHLIETENINYYTLKLVNNNPNDKASTFYNIIFEQNIQTGAVESKILQYNPELSWLFDKSEGFKGEVKKFDNNLVTLEDLVNGLDLNGESRLAQCVTGVSFHWGCTNPTDGPADQHDDAGDHVSNGGSCEGGFLYSLSYGPCPDPTETTIDDDNGPPGGGGQTNNDGDTTETVILELCDGGLQDPDGNGDEGGNGVDCEDDYSAYFTPYICGYDEDWNFIHNWAEDNYEEAITVATYLANNFPENDSENCADFDCLLDNVEMSSNSPFNVDFSNINSCSNEQIDASEVEDNEKFMCIYEKLTESNGFKNLFIDLFSESPDLNVKLELADLPDHVAGVTESNLNDIKELKIQINKNHLNTRHPIAIAQTIIHEAIHAFIKVKLYQCNNTGLTIQELNNKDLSDLLNEELEHVCGGVEGNSHNLMFDELVPYMESLLAEVFNDLVAPEDYNPDINYYPGNGDLHIFNWPTGLHYISMIGLSGTNAFDTEINGNQYEIDLYNQYTQSIQSPSPFNFNTCNQ